MSKHTPGPWFVDEDRDQNDQAQVTAGSGWLVAVVPHGCVTVMEPVMEANAALIAAAPNLLAACKRIAADGFGTAIGDLEFLKAAIAKAEGK